MAKISNLKIYADADLGKRVFTVPSADCAAVKMALTRRGYKVKVRKCRTGITMITII